jgi:hypothetical protein
MDAQLARLRWVTVPGEQPLHRVLAHCFSHMAATATREQLLAYIKKKTAAIKELEATNAQLLEAQQSSEASTSTLRHELEVQTAEAQAWQSQALEALAEVAHLKESYEKDQTSSLSAQQAAEAKEQVTLQVYAVS